MFLVLFHYTVHHNVNFPHYFIFSLTHILQRRKQTACNYTACQDKLSKHTFLTLLAVRVRNKGLWWRSILELCNCSWIQKTNASDWTWVKWKLSILCSVSELLKMICCAEISSVLYFHFFSLIPIINNNNKLMGKSIVSLVKW